MASPNAAYYTYFATVYDPQKGMDACRRLAAAFAVAVIRAPRTSRPPWRPRHRLSPVPRISSMTWPTAISTRRMPCWTVRRIGAEDHGAVLAAAAKLALVGAMAEAAECFDWHDVVACARFCADGLAPPAGGAP